MARPASARSATWANQVLLSGALKDSLTGGGPLGDIDLRLIDRDAGTDYPLEKKVRSDGSFAFFGQPATAFPLLGVQTYRLVIEVEAANYQPASFEIDLGPLEDQPEMVARTIPIPELPDTHVELFTGGGLPVTDITLALERNSVTLKGRVHVSGELTQSLAAAQVKVPGSPSLSADTDADGKFILPEPLPVARSVEILAEATGFEPKRFTYEPDYTRPVNNLSIALKPNS